MEEMTENVENSKKAENLEKKKPKKNFKIGKKSKLPKRENEALSLESNTDEQYMFTALKFLEYMDQAVGKKTGKNNPKKIKPTKKRKPPKQKVEVQLLESNEDKPDRNKIEKFEQTIEAQPLQSLKDERSLVMERLHFFVKTFIEEFGGKLDQYTGYMHEKPGTSMKNSIIPPLPKQPPSRGLGLGVIPQAMSVVALVEIFQYKQRIQKATLIIQRLKTDCMYKGVDLQRALIILGCTIFQNFEYQYMSLNEGQLQERIALATDAVERIVSSLLSEMYPENHEIASEGYYKFLYRCFLEGKSKGLIGNYFPRRKIRQNSKQIKISSMYDKVGLAILDENFKVAKYLKKKGNKGNTRKYGYRLFSVIDYKNEKDMETNIRDLYEEESEPGNAYQYVLRPADINETVQLLLKQNLLGENDFVKKLKSLPKLKAKL